MPRKQRFKPSRKPKPINEVAAPVRHIEDIEASQTAQTSRDDSIGSWIDDIERGRD